MTPADDVTRRQFLAAAAAAAAGAGAGAALPALAPGVALAAPQALPGQGAARGKEVAISSDNGLRATARAIGLVRAGADTLEAAVKGVNIVEEDPEDMTVGYGGLPNEDGVVQLDACVMHGPSWSCGSVAALERIKTPASVAKLVLERTDHIMLVGEGALRFALAQGFEPAELLTDKARKAWLAWRAQRSATDDWLTPEEGEKKLRPRPTGTITCLVLNAKGELSGVTSTSGLAFKIAGRVGDSPIIGAGLYVDGEVGAAGATGRGEAVITQGGSRIVVENMRHGMTPAQAVRDVLERIARQTVDPRLRDREGRPAFNVTLYALSKKGDFASGSLWSGAKFAVHDGVENRVEPGFHLFEKTGKEEW